MSTASERLAELGIELPAVAAPVGSYVPALEHNGVITTSGQVPFVNGSLPFTGIVGDTVTAEQAADAARIGALNALAAAAQVAGGIDNIERVLKVVGYVASAPTFGGQPGVLNAASNLLTEIFGDAGKHVRSAVGVAALPLGAPVEVELTVAVKA